MFLLAAFIAAFWMFGDKVVTIYYYEDKESYYIEECEIL